MPRYRACHRASGRSTAHRYRCSFPTMVRDVTRSDAGTIYQTSVRRKAELLAVVALVDVKSCSQLATTTPGPMTSRTIDQLPSCCRHTSTGLLPHIRLLKHRNPGILRPLSLGSGFRPASGSRSFRLDRPMKVKASGWIFFGCYRSGWHLAGR